MIFNMDFDFEFNFSVFEGIWGLWNWAQKVTIGGGGSRVLASFGVSFSVQPACLIYRKKRVAMYQEKEKGGG